MSSDENKRYEELSKNLDAQLTNLPKQAAETFESNVRRMKAEAIEQMDKAIKEGNLPAAFFYRTQVRMCKMMLMEY